MALIGGSVRQAVFNRMADASSGFTVRLSTEIAAAALTPPVTFVLPIDFSPTSSNFLQDDVNPVDLEETGPITYPFLTIFTPESHNDDREKFSLFAGALSVKMNFFVSWPTTQPPRDTQTFSDCVEAAMYATFNDQNLRDWANVASRPGINIVWTGRMSFSRSPLRQTSGENWMQILTATLMFEAHILSN